MNYFHRSYVAYADGGLLELGRAGEDAGRIGVTVPCATFGQPETDAE